MTPPPPGPGGAPFVAAAAAERVVPRFAPDEVELLEATELYERALAGRGPLVVRREDGAATILPVERWLGEPTAADEDVLSRCVAPVLDVGCGPGRLVAALAQRGCMALGVDITPAAVEVALGRGAAVVAVSVFDRLPLHWGSALLLDGNVGIGGQPEILLRRIAALLEPGGHVLVELDPPGTPTGEVSVRLELGGARSRWFRWAHLAADEVRPVAEASGLVVGERWSVGRRWFARLDRPGA